MLLCGELGVVSTMAKAAVVIPAGNESHADTGRPVNGLRTVRGFPATENGESITC